MRAGPTDAQNMLSRRGKRAQQPASSSPARSAATNPPPATPIQGLQPKPPRMVTGPEHAGVVDEGQHWGVWLNIRTAGQMGLYVRWDHKRPAPVLYLYNEQGMLRQPGIQLPSNGQQFFVDVPVGLTYVAVQNVAPSPQPLRIKTSIPAYQPPVPGMPRAA